MGCSLNLIIKLTLVLEPKKEILSFQIPENIYLAEMENEVADPVKFPPRSKMSNVEDSNKRMNPSSDQNKVSVVLHKRTRKLRRKLTQKKALVEKELVVDISEELEISKQSIKISNSDMNTI